MNAERHQVHLLVDKLPASQLSAVRTLLSVMLDPVARAIGNAPMDDEPETEGERRAVAEADAWLKDNTPIPFEDVLADLGLTQTEIRDYKDPE